METKLTQKQEKAVLHYIENGNKTKAFKYAYDTSRMKDKSINERASRFFSEIKVSTRVDEIRAKAESSTILNTQQKKELLTIIANHNAKILDGEKMLDPASARAAIAELNKMDGDYSPNKLEHTGEDGGPIKTENKWTIEFKDSDDK